MQSSLLKFVVQSYKLDIEVYWGEETEHTLCFITIQTKNYTKIQVFETAETTPLYQYLGRRRLMPFVVRFIRQFLKKNAPKNKVTFVFLPIDANGEMIKRCGLTFIKVSRIASFERIHFKGETPCTHMHWRRRSTHAHVSFKHGIPGKVCN